jgi:hypothetical protein
MWTREDPRLNPAYQNQIFPKDYINAGLTALASKDFWENERCTHEHFIGLTSTEVAQKIKNKLQYCSVF